MGEAKEPAASLHRSLNLALAIIGAVVLGLTVVHLVTSIEPVRLLGVVAAGALSCLLVLRLLHRTS